MPLFGFSWGSRRDDEEYDEEYEDDDDEYESYTDDEDDDDDVVEYSSDNDDDDNKDDSMIRQVNDYGDPDQRVNVSQESTDSKEEILEPQEFTRLLQQLPPTPEKGPHSGSRIERDNKVLNFPQTQLHNVTNSSQDVRGTEEVSSDSQQHRDEPQGNDDYDDEDGDGNIQQLNQNLYELQNLLFLAIEADRVDIVQELLQQHQQQKSSMLTNGNHATSTTSNNTKSFNLREYLLNPTVCVQQQEQENLSNGEASILNVNPSVRLSFIDLQNADVSTTGCGWSEYCCTTIPPIHIAIYYGSINALNYLLRSGANPALRPNISQMNEYSQMFQQQTEQKESDIGSLPTIQFLLDTPHIQYYNQCTAWEVAFGRRFQSADETNYNSSTSKTGNGSWSMFSSGTKGNCNSRSSNLTASKLDSIRHAFFTEAIRCISTDDVQRFQQLFHAGMPIAADDNDKASSTFTFTKWCHDFHANQCLQYITQQQTTKVDPTSSTDESTSSNGMNTNGHEARSMLVVGRKLPIVSEGLVSLQNRYEELDALCRSLSACLDNVAEEVSVGAGLLLSSNSNSSGAQALASHVRTVKNQREQLLDEYERYQETYQNSLDELLHYILQYNVKYNKNSNAKVKYWAEIRADEINVWWQENEMQMKQGPNILLSSTVKPTKAIIIAVSNANAANEENDDDQQREKGQNMITQIMILETKIRRIRATISDLSDENQRNQEEIVRRQLMVGLQYMRTLRNEIRDIEYQIYEMKQYDIDCRTKIRTIQNYLSSSTPSSQSQQGTKIAPPLEHGTFSIINSHSSTEESSTQNKTKITTNVTESDCVESNGNQSNHNNHSTIISKQTPDNNNDIDGYDTTQRDYTTTMVVHGPTRGFLSLNLWQILLRIIGMGGRNDNRTTMTHTATPDNRNHSNNTVSSSRPVIII